MAGALGSILAGFPEPDGQAYAGDRAGRAAWDLVVDGKCTMQRSARRN